MPPTDTSRRPSPEALNAARENVAHAIAFFFQHCLSAVLRSDVRATHRNLERYQVIASSLEKACTSSPSLSHVQTRVDKLVGLCDLSCKCKRASPSTPVSPQMMALVYDKYKKFFQMRNILVDVVRTYNLLVLPNKEATLADNEYPETVNGAVSAFMKNLSDLKSRTDNPVLNKIGSTIVKLHTMYKEAIEDTAKIEAYVHQQVEARRESGLCYFNVDFMGDDLLSLVAKKCNYRIVFRLRQVCSAFSKNETMKFMMPHLRIRLLPKLFPHDTKSCRAGQAVNVVYKNTAVTLVMDLAVTGELPDQRCGHFAMYSTRKRQPNGGWDSRGGESREVARRRRDDDSEVFARKAWAEVTVEVCTIHSNSAVSSFADFYGVWSTLLNQEGMFCKRLDSFAHFRDGLKCSVELVYADTLQPIVSATRPLVETHKVIRNTTRMSMYTANDKSPHPAFTVLHVERVTSQDNGRRYCIKATASGVALSTGQQVNLVHYSPAFEVVASKRTVGKRGREAR
jgi:hypothetical protein